MPGIIGLSEIAMPADGFARIVLEAAQGTLIRVVLQIARNRYEARRERQRQGVELAKARGVYCGA